ncbi:gelsolin-like protein 2 [Saccostrea echinata]|uniref:gelsolin-like protein 2 n=1 Tax=Saccostrea echinata TaxID=191078 RepID=UPI002A82FFC4|nr:gelsolin-like protein 2 [Saccostrea echinata]
MTGLIKQKQYDWKDSNLALFGSKEERDVKKTSAACEKAWKTAGLKPGIQIWRIVNFKVTKWPEEDYGKFYDGDSYIVLNTYKKEDSDALLYDVHFWIGKYSTQDEYATAAYKTVELDTFLDDIPVQHREVQGHESQLFKSYFNPITYLHGGAESGFRQVKPEQYTPRLFHFHGDKFGVMVKEIPRMEKYIDDTDVYILDLGLQIYQYNGEGANKDERVRALQYVNQLRGERSGKAVKATVLDQVAGSTGVFLRYLDQTDADEDFDTEAIIDQTDDNPEPELYRLSDAEGDLKFSLEKTGPVKINDFDGNDVFIFDTRQELFVWVGKQTTEQERKNAMTYAHNYLMKTSHPLIPVSCLNEGATNKSFQMALTA